MNVTVKFITVATVTALLVGATLSVAVAGALTAADSQLSQSITAGVISTSLRDASGAIVANPSFSLSSVAASTVSQTATGSFGSASQRITVDNPGGANNGWTLALAATAGASAAWTDGSTSSYAFNGTTATGQLSVNPSIATITPVSGTLTGVTKGTASTFTAATPITIMTASSLAANVWNGYITGVGVSQLIPASTPVGTYTIDMTQTVTAQ